MEEPLGARLGQNVQTLREQRGLTQQQLARIAGLPRATWAHVESGGANPTLAVLHRVATALAVSLEELVAPPRASARLYARDELPARVKSDVHVRKLLPDPLPGLDLERLELPARSRMAGVPHTPGTREYLTCERGELVLVASGARFTLTEGDVVAFRGDQRHAYLNETTRVAVGYSAVVLSP